MKDKKFIILLVFIMTICFGFLEPATALVVFDDGQTHNVDWIIDDDVYVGFYGSPSPPPDPPSINQSRITTLNLLRRGGVMGMKGESKNVAVYYGGIVNIEGAYIQGDLRVFEYGVATISSGTILDDVIVSSYYGTYPTSLTISGGWIGDKIRAGFYGGCHATITIVGTDFAVDGVPIDYVSYPYLRSWSTRGWDSYYGVLTGTLANGDPINNSYYIATGGTYGNSNIILAEPIPEPATLLLFALGSLILIKTKIF